MSLKLYIITCGFHNLFAEEIMMDWLYKKYVLKIRGKSFTFGMDMLIFYVK